MLVLGQCFGSFVALDACKEWASLHLFCHLALSFSINKLFIGEFDLLTISLRGDDLHLCLDLALCSFLLDWHGAYGDRSRGNILRVV